MTATMPSLAVPTPGGVQMNKELFGVFGSEEQFREYRAGGEFDAVVGGEAVTVGVRDPALGEPRRTAVHEAANGHAVVWGEAAVDDGTAPARRLYEACTSEGTDGVSRLSGSYVAVVEHDGQAFVAVDHLRSWECFYTDVGVRAFGTDLATVAGLPVDLPVSARATLEFLHLGTVLGERTLFEPVERVPFDSVLTADRTLALDRVVYDPQEFAYVDDLAARLRRAIARRRGLPGRKGILLSAGQDSRSMLPCVPDFDRSYTVGSPDAQEVSVARRIADQYGIAHEVLVPDERYLLPDDRKVLYSQGVRESLHVHHAGFTDALDVDSIYHGLLYDTLLKGYFLERDGVELFDTKLRSQAVSPDVDPAESLLDTLGFLPGGSADLLARADRLLADLDVSLPDPDPRSFLEDAVRTGIDDCRGRADSVHNAMDLFVLRNQPAMSFRTHLADNFVEAFVAADAELLEWHLQTPPSHRHPETVRAAISALDEDVFRHCPPARRGRPLLNQVERFARRTLPLVEPVEPAWPDRRTVYRNNDIGRRLFPEYPGVQALPPRLQLRLNDLRWWLSVARGRS